MKKNLLKDAIADAKTVKEVALANAKIALEEALSPQLNQMLEQKLTEDEDLEDDEVPAEEIPSEEAPTEEVPPTETEEVPTEEPEVNNDELEEIIRELEGDDENTEDDVVADETLMEDDEDIDISLEDDEEPVEEEIDVDPDSDDDMIPNEDETEDKSKELGEAYKVIGFLRDKLNEVNLLNAKLMYVTKLFKGSNLSEGRKVKIIETFDRAKTVREAKLIYSTLVEQVNNVTAARPKAKTTVTALKESMASAVKVQKGTPKQKDLITESADTQIARFKKLANLG